MWLVIKSGTISQIEGQQTQNELFCGANKETRDAHIYTHMIRKKPSVLAKIYLPPVL